MRPALRDAWRNGNSCTESLISTNSPKRKLVYTIRLQSISGSGVVLLAAVNE